MTKKPAQTQQGHRIGAVSAISGVPVPTLRVWETRYVAFEPRASGGGHRLYTDDDVLRATLLRRLTASGHSISSIANLGSMELHALLQQHAGEQGPAIGPANRGQTVHVAVVGVGLAAQLSALKFRQAFSPNQVQVTSIAEDLDAALARPSQAPPHILVVQVNTLHVLVQAALQRLIHHTGVAHVIVLYRFGQEAVARSLHESGVVMRRGAVTDHELSDLLRSAMRITPAALERPLVTLARIPARKYDDATLARMAAISTNVLCECPRHVSELISQLASFEQYSAECLNKNAEDAELHAYLRTVSGSARVLFEEALERVAQHEGLDLSGGKLPALVE